MPKPTAVVFSLLIAACPVAIAADVTLVVSDLDGAAARVAAPVSVNVDLKRLFGDRAGPDLLQLVELTDGAHRHTEPLPAQFEPESQDSLRGTLWWLMPPGGQGQRRFRLTATPQPPAVVMKAHYDEQRKLVDVAEGDLPVLRYNHGTVPVPEGTAAKYARGDYISPLYGPEGEILTDDYPRDHPHHRGVSWSWPVTRWGKEVRDIWAVVGVWARPVAMRRVDAGPVAAVIDAESVWKWGNKDPIVREEVVIRAFRQSDRCRAVDVEVRLTALADEVAIGGRPKAGYGGFGLRAAPAEERQITVQADTSQSNLPGAWLDYSGVFAGGKGPAGVTILENLANPGYPSKIQQYPQCNYVMPAFPGPREVPLEKNRPLVLKHRLWIHSGSADEKMLSDVWSAYARPPKVTITD